MAWWAKSFFGLDCCSEKQGRSGWAAKEGLDRNSFGLPEKNSIAFRILFKDLISKPRDLNNTKPNLKGIQNRINSNELFGNFSILEIWKLV
jgi:hypothetical protein